MSKTGYRVYLRGSALTDTGRVRQNNEDSVHLWAHEQHVVAIVADGMGGAAAGEEASRTAIETIQHGLMNGEYPTPDAYENVHADVLADRLREVVVNANLNIVDRAEKHPEFKGMGTTLTMLFARHTDVILAHVGDSRAYLINGNNGDIVQLTADHSFVQALVDAGHISPEEAEDHPMKNVLYRALGQGDEIEVDIQQGLHLHIGDRLVMCSDGLTLHVKAHEIADIAMQEETPQGCSRRLVDLANDRGGRDNISVISIYVVRAPAEEPEETAMSQDEEDADFLDEDDEPTFLMHDRSSLRKPEQDTETPRDSAIEISHSEVDGEGRDLSEPEFHS